MRTSIPRLLAVVLAVLAVVFSAGQFGIAKAAPVTPVGTLVGDNKVILNGKPMSGTQQTITQLAFPGDTVEVVGGIGTLQTSQNGLVKLANAAKATVERSGNDVWLGLQNGVAAVREGDQPMSVRAHGGKISAQPGSIFQISQDKNDTYVTAVKGDTLISEGGLVAPQYVKQGQSVKVAFLEPGPLGGSPGAPQDQKAVAACEAQLAAAPRKDDNRSCKDLKAVCDLKTQTNCTEFAARCTCEYLNDSCKLKDDTCKAAAATKDPKVQAACEIDTNACPEHKRRCTCEDPCNKVQAWLNTVTYSTDSGVLYDNKVYLSQKDGNLNQVPGANSPWWSSKGKDGKDTKECKQYTDLKKTCKPLHDQCDKEKDKVHAASCIDYSCRCRDIAACAGFYFPGGAVGVGISAAGVGGATAATVVPALVAGTGTAASNGGPNNQPAVSLILP